MSTVWSGGLSDMLQGVAIHCFLLVKAVLTNVREFLGDSCSIELCSNLDSHLEIHTITSICVFIVKLHRMEGEFLSH